MVSVDRADRTAVKLHACRAAEKNARDVWPFSTFSSAQVFPFRVNTSISSTLRRPRTTPRSLLQSLISRLKTGTHGTIGKTKRATHAKGTLDARLALFSDSTATCLTGSGNLRLLFLPGRLSSSLTHLQAATICFAAGCALEYELHAWRSAFGVGPLRRSVH